VSTVRWARIGYSLVAWLFAIAAIIQIYLAGTAISQLGGTNDFELHRNIGYGIAILGLILLVLSFAAKMPARVIGATALLFVLMIVQSVLVFMKVDQPNIAALHPVIGFIIVLLAAWLAWRTLTYIRAPLPPEPVRASPPSAPTPAPRPTLDQQDEQEDRL
jgi:cytochrome b561